MQNLKFDSRMTERHLSSGQITKEEWAQHLSKLPDMAHNIETLSMEQDETEDDLDSATDEQH
jgi:hypothetical protein